MSDDLLASTNRWLEKSGRALELRVARSLRWNGGAEAVLGAHYEDPKTGTLREGDVLARFPWTSMANVRCSISVSIECKSSTKHPWVSFYTDENVYQDRALDNWFLFLHGPFNGVMQPAQDLWPGMDPFTFEPVASSIAAAHVEDSHNPAYDSVRQALSYSTAIRIDYTQNQSTQHVGIACLAAVVTSAPLITCRLDEAGAIKLAVVDKVCVWGYGADGKRHRVFVLSEEALPKFAQDLSARVREAEEQARFRGS